jgi:hypothetical protein
MLNPRAVLSLVCVGAVAACSGGESAPRADIAHISEVKSTFGSQFQVSEVAPTGIDPKLLTPQTIPEGMTFEPADCATFATAQVLPTGLKGNMAATSAEGEGNRFIAIAVETSDTVPVNEPGPNCQKVGYAGGPTRGLVEVVEAPKIDGVTTLGTHRILQTVIDGKPRTGELYNYVASFGTYMVIVTANPLVVPDKPVTPVDTQRARDLLTAAVGAVQG